MSDRAKTKEQLLQENELLRSRLEEAEAALEAIRSGEVDALVVSSEEGDQIFTLQGADHPYRVMVETMSEGAATLLEDGIILYANLRLAGMLGEPLETLIGASLLDFISPEDCTVIEGLVEQGVHRASRAEIRFRRRDGSSLPVLISSSPTQVEGAQALCLVATDLTEQKRSEEIVAAERLARSILDQATEAILVCDTDGKIIRANQKALQTFLQNLIYKHFEEALPLVYKNRDGDGRTFSITNVLDGESFQEIEAEYPYCQGENRFFLLSAAPLLKDQDQIIGCIVTLTEMTERKRAEEALRISEQHTREILESISDGFFSFDREWRLVYINELAAEQGGYQAQELVGRVIWDAVPILRGSHLEAIYRQVMQEREVATTEFHSPLRGRWFQLRVYPSAEGISVYSMDITERKRTEAALRESEERFRTVFERAEIGIVIGDMDGRVIESNPAFEQMLGYTRQELQQRAFIEFTHPDDAMAEWSLVQEVLSGKRDHYEIEKRYFRKDGQMILVRLIGNLVRSEQGEPLLGLALIEDITERKRIEEALRESEERFRTMADGTPVMIWMTDAAGGNKFVNRAYCEFFGVTLAVVQAGGWQPLVHPEDAAGYVDVYLDCLRERRPFRAQARVRRYDGEWRWVDSHGQPRFSEAGEILGMVGSSMDITARKRDEELIRSYSARLERSNQELEEFAFIASHDLQEPLRKIEGFGKQVGKRSSLEETDRDYLQRMQNAARRMRNMIDDLLELSRVTTHSKPYERVDLNQVAKTVVDDLEPRIRKAGGRVVIYPLTTLEADAVQMHQLLLNLVGNAVKYHRPGIPPVVEVGCRESSPGWVEITIQDNGIGFEMSLVEQIFQPFQRLHGRNEYEGSGMGLAICRKIVERHGGTITADSKPEQGSRFMVTLPVKQTG